MRYLIGENAAAAPRQADWLTCGKCKSMFWNGRSTDKGICPEQGLSSHRAEGLEFHLPHDMPGAGQDQWKFCRKCFCLIFEPHNADGNCAAGGIHTPEGFNFRLEHA